MAHFVGGCCELDRITNMSGQPQSTNSKKCISCHRTLNYEFFGESRASKDGFNTYCRQCKNQGRRIDYGKSNEEILLNLAKNNNINVPVFNGGDLQFNAKAVLLSDWSKFFVKIKVDESFVKYEIQDSAQVRVFIYEFCIQLDKAQSLLRIRRDIINDLTHRSLRIVQNEQELEFLQY